jgi:hypothetical protein
MTLCYCLEGDLVSYVAMHTQIFRFCSGGGCLKFRSDVRKGCIVASVDRVEVRGQSPPGNFEFFVLFSSKFLFVVMS